MTILCYFKIYLVTFVQRITLKSMFSKKAYKSVARVPGFQPDRGLYYIYLLVFHVLMPQFPKKIGDPRFLTDNLFL
jgi:hypothetical protein